MFVLLLFVFHFLQIPDWIPAPLASMLRLLLQKDSKARLRSACGWADRFDPFDPASAASAVINYDGLRGHEMFRDAHCTSQYTSSAVASCNNHANVPYNDNISTASTSSSAAVDELSTVAGVSTVYSRPAARVPQLRELCIRAVGRASLVLAAAIAENGGLRPSAPAWMQVS